MATAALSALVLIALAGTLFLLPVAVLLAGVWALLAPVVQLERRSGARALARAARLFLGSATTTVPLAVICLLVVLLLGLLLSSLVFVVFTAPFYVIEAVPGVVSALTWPLVSVVLAYAYANAVTVVDQPA